MVAPNGGETWNIESEYIITWEARNVNTISIDYTTDNGSSWNKIDSSINAETQSYRWTIPDTPGEECRVRITDESGSGTQAQSYATFTIEQSKPYLVLTGPNGGQVWEVGNTETITWNAENIDTVTLYFSNDNDRFWKRIETGVDASTGSYKWLVPDYPSTECRIRVVNDMDFALNAQSSAVFTVTLPDNAPWVRLISPNGFEEWQGGTQEDVVWESQGSLNLSIGYSLDGGTTWNPVDNDIPSELGTYTLDIPWDINSTESRIFIGDPDLQRNDWSERNFTILKSTDTPEITLTSPNGGEQWEAGGSYEIEWTSKLLPEVNIFYTYDYGIHFEPIAEGVDASSGSYSWAIPDTLSVEECHIWIGDPDNDEISDASDEPFSIQPPPEEPTLDLTFPNEPGNFDAGSTMKITWDAVNVGHIKITCKHQDGEWPVIDSIDASLGSFNWDIPDDLEFSSCYIFIQAVNDENIWDESTESFTIFMPGMIEVKVPNGGENWFAGSRDIEWNSENVATVFIRYSVDDGENWLFVADDIAASTGSYNWHIPDNLDYQECRIKIVNSDNPEIEDVSDGMFTLKPRPQVTLDYPTGDDEFDGDQKIIIRWTAQSVDKVKIQFSTNGTTYSTIAGADNIDAGQGSFEWTVTKLALRRVNCYIRIVDTVNQGIFGRNQDPFTVNPPPVVASIDLTQPNGDEELVAGDTYTIIWTSTDVAVVDIEYSTDGGTTWDFISDDYNATKLSVSWLIPEGIESNNCLVRITDVSNPAVNDESENPFRIVVEAVANIEITFPDGGDRLVVGDEVQIRWESPGVDEVRIYYSIHGEDGPWILISNKTSSTGIYNWAIPESAISDSCKIKIVDVADNADEDTSDDLFSIVPNITNENATIRIDTNLEEHGRQPFTPVSGVGANELIGFAIYGEQWASPGFVYFELNWNSDVALFKPDISFFTVPQNQSHTINGVSLTLPEEGNIMEKFGGDLEYSASETSPGTVIGYIEQKEDVAPQLNDGLLYLVVFETTGTFSSGDSLIVDLHVEIDDDKGTKTIDRKFRASAQNAFVNVITPEGGEQWESGSQQTISWNTKDVNNIAVYYSTQGDQGPWGNIDTDVDVTQDTTDLLWDIPEDIDSQQCFIKIEAVDVAGVVDVSNVFRIFTVEKELRLTSPTGGQEFKVRAGETISWTSSGISLVTIEYSNDGGSTWKPVMSNVNADDGEYSWEVPDDPSTTCRIKISNAEDSSLFDESPNNFTIVSGDFVNVESPSGGDVWSSGVEYDIES